MSPTLNPNQIVLTTNMSKISRGDVIVAKREEEKDLLVKRIIGLPGETVEYKNGVLYINNQETSEPYIKIYSSLFKKDELDNLFSKDFLLYNKINDSEYFTEGNTSKNFKFVLEENEYFILGDFRIVSNDSRHFGPIKRSEIIGEVKSTIFRY